MFSPATFGSLEYPSDETFGYTYAGNSLLDSRIRDGRWKHILADVVYETPDGFGDLVKNFGYLRAPWNLNPSPFVSRFTNYNAAVPECSDHYDLVAKYDSLSDFLQVAPYAPHARIHGSIGSTYGCDKMAAMLEAGLIQSQTQQVLLCTQWPIILKVLYRKHFIEAADKDECTRPVIANVDSFSCGFSCMDDGSGAIEKYLYTLMHKYTGDTLTDDDWTTWKEFICEGDGPKIFAGDHLESASPADPSFWPVHPTLERLYQAKMMAGGFKDAEWATDAQNDFVCDKAQCYSDVTGTLEFGEDCCYGHYEDSQFLNFVSGNRSSHYGDTNGAIMKAADPTSSDYSMPYIYDTFTWNHCSPDFQRLLVDMKEEMEEEEQEEEEEETKVNVDEEKEEKDEVEDEQYAPTHKPTHSPNYIRPTNHPTVTGYTHRPTHDPSAKPTRQPTVTMEAMDEQASSNSLSQKAQLTSSPSFSPSKRPSRTLRPTAMPSSSTTKSKSKSKDDSSKKKRSRQQNKASKDRM
jgi:hypothetical protein